MRRTATTALVAAVSAVLLVAPGTVARAHVDAATPVIFVHGRNADPGVWGAAISSLERQGYPADRLFAWDYDSSQSTNETLAGRLSGYVDHVLAQTGATKVDIVAHSLGSLPSRWYVKFGNGGHTVKNWISLAGPNHGTGLAWFCAIWDQGCRDMTPGSYVLSRLNQGVEAPGPVRHWTFWSSCDEQILPASSTGLSGATNIRTGCLKHNDLLADPSVVNAVSAILTNY